MRVVRTDEDFTLPFSWIVEWFLWWKIAKYPIITIPEPELMSRTGSIYGDLACLSPGQR